MSPVTAQASNAVEEIQASDPIEEILDMEHPCEVVATPPVQHGQQATGKAEFTCPNPHRHMTIHVALEVFTQDYGFQTVATNTCSSGTTPTNTTLPCPVTGTVCIPGATLMKTTGYGYWKNSKGQTRGNNYAESRPVPVVCSAAEEQP